MIYCANCLHCKVKVDVFAFHTNLRWARFAYCVKGKNVSLRDSQIGRLLSNVRSMKKSQCDDYEPMIEPSPHYMDEIRKYKSSVSFEGLDWYYKNGIPLDVRKRIRRVKK